MAERSRWKESGGLRVARREAPEKSIEAGRLGRGMRYALPPFRMRRSLPALLVFLVWAFAFTARTAHAQTTTSSGPSVSGINNGIPIRLEPNLSTSADNQGENPHPGSVAVNYINYQDCAANLVLQFQLAISGINPSYNLDAWAGTQDCTQLANRQSATAVCWPVFSPTIATTNPFVVNVQVEDIVSQVTPDTSHAVSYTPANSDVCQLQTATGATNITLYFFFQVEPGTPPGRRSNTR